MINDIRNRRLALGLRVVCVFLGFAALAVHPCVWAGTLGPAKTFDETLAWAEAAAADNPDLVRLVVYGESVEGRPLIALHITGNVQQHHPDRMEFLFTGGIHAREVISSEVVWQLADQLIGGYGTDPDITHILDTREVWLMPVLNPDGRIAVENGLLNQRKNMQLYEGQTPGTREMGVDLNRNFPHRFEFHDPHTPPQYETWGGPTALSEPESYHLWELLNDTSQFDRIVAAIDYHSGIKTIFRPWLNPFEHFFNPMPPEDAATFDRLTDGLFELTGYPVQGLWYSAWGTLMDSLYAEFGTFAFVQELNDYFYPADLYNLEYDVSLGIAAAMYLLSDEALIVPEPASVTLIALGALLIVRRRNAHRIGIHD